VWVSVAAAALLLVACGQGATRIDQPRIDVYAMLTSLPPEANALPLAMTYPGTNYYLDPLPDRLVWRFTHNGIEYARMTAEVTADGDTATRVSTYFEDVRDNPAVAKFDFLRRTARIAAEASLAAALAKRPVDQQMVRNEIAMVYVNDPVATQMKTIEGIAQQMDEMAPPRSEDSDNPEVRRRAQQMQDLRGCGSVNGVPNPC
jgi:hypothetical protein